MSQVLELPIAGAWLIKPEIYLDNRGSFREWYKKSLSEDSLFSNFQVNQANVSISKKGAIRGMHYSLAKAGQAKVITCLYGEVFDVIADIRVGSPTFGKWTSVILSPENGHTIYISQGLAHGVMALKEGSAVSYLLSSEYSPREEHGINPFDPDLAIDWPIKASEISEKDLQSYSLSQMRASSLLPEL